MDWTKSNKVRFLHFDIQLIWDIFRGVYYETVISLQIVQKLFIKIFFSLIWSKNFEFSSLLLHFISEFLELFKSFKFVCHKIHISISWIVIDKNNIEITIASLHIKWSAHISVYQDKYLSGPLLLSYKRYFGYLFLKVEFTNWIWYSI